MLLIRGALRLAKAADWGGHVCAAQSASTMPRADHKNDRHVACTMSPCSAAPHAFQHQHTCSALDICHKATLHAFKQDAVRGSTWFNRCCHTNVKQSAAARLCEACQAHGAGSRPLHSNVADPRPQQRQVPQCSMQERYALWIGRGLPQICLQTLLLRWI